MPLPEKPPSSEAGPTLVTSLSGPSIPIMLACDAAPAALSSILTLARVVQSVLLSLNSPTVDCLQLRRSLREVEGVISTCEATLNSCLGSSQASS